MFHQFFGKNLPIYGIPNKLKGYHTTKKDIADGNEFIPPSEFRIKSEDIYEEEQKSRQESESVVSYGSLSSAYESSGSFDADIMTLNNNISLMRSDTMFQKKKDEKTVVLKDFVIKSVIGKGSFGKVFLVQKNSDKN